jgi:hypothetical protein
MRERLGWQVLTSGSLTMTNTLYWPQLSGAQPDRASGLPAKGNPKPSLFTRLVTAMIEVRQRQADEYIARYIEGRGSRITDALERDIQNYILTPNRRL